MAWDYEWDAGTGIVTLSPMQPKPFKISKEKLQSSTRRSELVRSYEKQNIILSNHIALLDGVFEKETSSVEILLEAIVSMTEIYMKAFEKIQAMRMYKIAINQTKSRRTVHQETLVLNAEFYQECFHRLGIICEEYESLIGDGEEPPPLV